MADLVPFTSGSQPPTEPPSLPWDLALWSSAITEAREDAKDLVRKGRENVEAYLGYDTLGRARGQKFAAPPNDFTFTSQKVALLWYRTPDIHLKAEEENARMRAPLFAAVLNQRILPKAHIQDLMDRLVTDVVLPAGLGACKIGYRGYDEQTQEPETQPDPLTGVPTPVIDPATGQPKLKMRTISEHFDAERIPPGRFLFPVDFLGGNFHDAAWLGYDFYEIVEEGGGGVSSEDEDQLLQVGKRRKGRRGSGKTKKRRVTQVWYKAHPVDPEAHPDEIRYFEWVKGDPQPRKHEMSPNQFPRPDGTMGGWNKYPILVLTTRTLPDAPVPPSDCDITRHLFDEISEGRTQLLISRDRNLPQNAYDSTRVTDDTKRALEKNIQNANIPFNGPVSEETIRPINKGHINAENFEFNAVAERDGKAAWSIGDNQLGLTSQGGAKTATEIQSANQNAATRLDYERSRVVAFFCDELVAGLASLVQQFAAKYDFVELQGPATDPASGQPIPTGETRYAQWDRARVQGDFTYTVQAGAALRHDALAEYEKAKEIYTLSRQDPGVNPGEVTRIFFEAAGQNWEKVRQTPPPPRPGPKDVLALVKSPEIDLNPMSPHYPNILALLEWGGAPVAKMLPAGTISLDPMTGLPVLPPQDEAGAAPDFTHGGTQPETEPIDKHVADLTGELPGGGSMVATNRVQ
jgi:hypothetical protein